MKSVWVRYPHLSHSEIVYSGAEGEVWFGGQMPAHVDDTVFTDGRVVEHLGEERLCVFEPPIVSDASHDNRLLRNFRVVYTFGASGLPNVRHYRMGLPPLWPSLPATPIRTPWSMRKHAVACVTGNKYGSRIGELHQYAEMVSGMGLGFDVYGRPGFDGESWYRGEIPGGAASKRALLSEYRYCLALENTTNLEWYLTEKLLDGLAAGCFCFYHGAPGAFATYPEIPWKWVDRMGSAPEHQSYLDSLVTVLPHIRREITLDPLWRMVLEDTE